MEFRFFFPLLLPNDDWIPLEMRNNYENELNHMKNYFLQRKATTYPENRCDSYYVGGHSVGVKLRAGKKMEIKLRKSESNNVPGAEVWIKHKLGKSNLHAYESEINDLLDRNNIARDRELFERNLVGEVNKKRYQGNFGVDFEITFLQLQFSPPMDFTNRDWISICFEGSETRLIELLEASNSPILPVLSCLCALLSIQDLDPTNSLTYRLYPILSGYPAWLNSFVNSSLPSTSSIRALIDRSRGSHSK